MSSSDLEKSAEMNTKVAQLLTLADELTAQPNLEHVNEELVQRLLTLAIKLYAAKLDVEDPIFPFTGDDALTAVEVGLTITQLIKALDIELFELAMWQNLG